MRGEIGYVRSGDASIAYQVAGEGPVDLVFVPDFVSNLVYGWECRPWREFYEALAAFSRLILFDKRGTGLSDRGGAFPTLETRMEDVRAVLDEVGSERTALLGSHDGCAMASLFAATYPERTAALALFAADVRGTASPDYPWAPPPAYWRESLPAIRARWGTQDYTDELLAEICPTLLESAEDRRWVANWLRLGASPAAAHALNRMAMEIDLADVLPAIHVPTLVLHRAPARAAAENLAERIVGARTAEVSGSDEWGIFLSPELPAVVRDFLESLERRPAADRVLATLLFTDIVGSTASVARLGDRRWGEVVARHHALVRAELARHRGREVDTAGDGFFATFDGPARAIACAQAIGAALAAAGLEVRAGIHTGECELVGGKPTGLAVHVGARVAALAGGGEVLVSSTVRDLVAGSGIEFEPRGEHELKGVPGSWALHAVA